MAVEARACHAVLPEDAELQEKDMARKASAPLNFRMGSKLEVVHLDL